MITAARSVIHGPCHWYKPDGTPVWSVPNKSKPGEQRSTTARDARALGLWPSPTTVTKLLHRHALVEYLCEQAVLAAVTTPRREGEELDAFIQRVLHTDRVQDEERDAAAERGRSIHRSVQTALLNAYTIPTDWQEIIMPVVRACNELGRCVATEKVLIGNGYCGTADCILENETEVWALDFKTTRTIPASPYDEAKLQVSAYSAALGNTGEKRIRSAIIYISTIEPGLISVKETEWQSDYERFKLLLNFFKLTNKL